MKLSRSTTVLLAVLVLVCGTAVVIHAATTPHPVKLCKNSTTGVVTATKSDGTCRSGSKAFLVGSSADVKSLMTRMSNAESRIAELEALQGPRVQVYTYPVGGDQWGYEVFGVHLQGLSVVQYQYTVDGIVVNPGGQYGPPATTFGVFSIVSSLPCDFTDFSVHALALGDVPVTSNVIAKGAGCP